MSQAPPSTADHNKRTTENIYNEPTNLEYLKYISPTFKSSPLFGPELTPPLYNSSHQNSCMPQIQSDYSHSPISMANLGRPYPINNKGNRAMALEDRFENDPKMYHIWPQESDVYSRLLLREKERNDLSNMTDQEIKEANQKMAWGTHIHEYAGIGGLSFLGRRARTRDLDVARSHRHYLSGMGFSKHDKVTRNRITPFKKSLNRQCDDLIPPASSIPLHKYQRLIEQNKFIQEDCYASHKNRTEMFPLRSSQYLGDATEEAIQQLIKNRYATSYSTNFDDPRANTSLKLGPQFQFYDDGLEGEVYEREKELLIKVAKEKAIRDAGGEIESESDSDSEDTLKESDGEEGEEKKAEESQDKTDVKESEESQDETEAKEAEESQNESEDKEDKKSTDPEEDNTAAWPAWPGNRCNHIDPVTLKIAEKRDVLCLQDKSDVKTLHHQHQNADSQALDYKIPENLDHAITSADKNSNFKHKFAPAIVDFAYSGVPCTYGNREELYQQPEFIDLKEKLRPQSKFDRLNREVEQNIIRKVMGRPRLMSGRSLYHQAANAEQEENRMRVSESVENLRNTIESLREPTGGHLPPLFMKEEIPGPYTNSCHSKFISPSQNLPPLWETLDYTSNRVVDQLGVRYKSIAQNRFHQVHPESKETKCSSNFLAKQAWLKQGDRHTTYRRQYYNGYHMASNFR